MSARFWFKKLKFIQKKKILLVYLIVKSDEIGTVNKTFPSIELLPFSKSLDVTSSQVEAIT